LEEESQKMLTGFDFQIKGNRALFFYKYPMNFPKLFLKKSVEKKGKAIRKGISMLIHTVLIFEGLK